MLTIYTKMQSEIIFGFLKWNSADCSAFNSNSFSVFPIYYSLRIKYTFDKNTASERESETRNKTMWTFVQAMISCAFKSLKLKWIISAATSLALSINNRSNSFLH